MNRNIAPVINRIKLQDKQSDFAYWQSRNPAERLTALEEIRKEYPSWKYANQKNNENVQPGFQRVYRIVKQ
jgi:hypothetical protein